MAGHSQVPSRINTEVVSTREKKATQKKGNFVHHICSLILNSLKGDHGDSSPADVTSSENDAGEPSSKIPRRGEDHSTADGTSIIAESDTVNTQELVKLMVKNDKDELVIFCDQGVYTKNRNFRLYKSSKFGKSATLEVAKENTYKVRSAGKRGSFCKDHDYLIFLESLVSNVSLRESGKDVRVLTFESTDSKQKRKGASQGSSQEGSSGHSDDALSGYAANPSPYPLIDEFIGTVICKGDVQGYVRRWVFFPQGKLLMYDIDNNRWCDNIGRQHKSNHIMMVVDLRNGVYYQKCHDPECKKIDYRSPEQSIPMEIDPFNQDTDLDRSIEEELAEDNDDLCIIAEAAEKAALHGDSVHQSDDHTQSETKGMAEGKMDDSRASEGACHDSELPLDSNLFDDDEEWTPWEDLPSCTAIGDD